VDASTFISRRLRYNNGIAMTAIAISFLVILLAVSIAGGYRRVLRRGIADIAGDIRVTNPALNYMGEDDALVHMDSLSEAIMAVEGVSEVTPAIYRAGIVKSDDEIAGAIFKGVPGGGDSLGIRIPSRLAEMLSLSVGDEMLSYFVGERVRVRKWRIDGIYDSVLPSDDGMVVFAGLADMRRLNGWADDEASALEVRMSDGHGSPEDVSLAAAMIGAAMLEATGEFEDAPVAVSAMSAYPQIFSWLDLLDYNVGIILILMILVAGFNMVSGLLILLFRNISTIGVLKTMGMRDSSIAGVFLRVSSTLVLKGMAWGDGIALLFCLVQGTTKLIRLNPENYFVSYVPIHVSPGLVVAMDLVAYVGIMCLLLIPSLYVSRIDPAKTVRAQ